LPWSMVTSKEMKPAGVADNLASDPPGAESPSEYPGRRFLLSGPRFIQRHERRIPTTFICLSRFRRHVLAWLRGRRRKNNSVAAFWPSNSIARPSAFHRQEAGCGSWRGTVASDGTSRYSQMVRLVARSG
jgi:hypothetical protein